MPLPKGSRSPPASSSKRPSKLETQLAIISEYESLRQQVVGGLSDKAANKILQELLDKTNEANKMPDEMYYHMVSLHLQVQESLKGDEEEEEEEVLAKPEPKKSAKKHKSAR